MADSYAFVKGGKLKLKGIKDKSHKKHKHKKRKREQEEQEDDTEKNDDTQKHGGWWEIESFAEIKGGIAIETSHMTYIQAEDNGLFRTGVEHTIGEGPLPEEVLTAVPIGETKIALKSGYNKYLSVTAEGTVVGRSDAIGVREQLEPVFQQGEVALLGCNQCFVSLDTAGDIVCKSDKALKDEIFKLRSCAQKEKKSKDDVTENVGTSKTVELNYVKKFQSFQDRHIRLSKEDRAVVKQAKEEGNLHEVLLDRRKKMKSDRYC